MEVATRKADMFAARDIEPGEVLQRRKARDDGAEATGGGVTEGAGRGGEARGGAARRETKPWRVHVAARTGTVEDSDTESDAEWDSESEDEWETGDEMEVWGEGPPREVEPERDK